MRLNAAHDSRAMAMALSLVIAPRVIGEQRLARLGQWRKVPEAFPYACFHFLYRLWPLIGPQQVKQELFRPSK